MPIKAQQTVLVVGGAGYIGSHMVMCLLRAGYKPLVLDNLSTGHRDAVRNAELIVGDIHDTACLTRLFAEHDIKAVMHFAGFIQVNESVKDPAKYYHNNVAGTLNLLNAMLQASVQHFIFSSTAAVYGEPQYTPIDESHLIAPINPYGHSKVMVEQMLVDFSRSYALKFSALRYFNASGADSLAGLAERHEPETHLIPLILQVAAGDKKNITVYGDNYPTVDGTCVRDYIHVNDICDAHLLALEALWQGGKSCTYNLGTGHGYSVQQVIDAARRVTGREIQQVMAERRAGDPAVLVADASLVVRELGWQPKQSDIETIIKNVWQTAREVVS
jgi:UDP-glucose 4-epimerase